MTPAEAAATALAPLVREHGWTVERERGWTWVEVLTGPIGDDGPIPVSTIWCLTAQEAARLAALLRGEA